MTARRLVVIVAALGMIFWLGSRALHAQQDPKTYQALRWRSIGPDRGGRVTAVAGLVNDRMVYYMGATGGGVWKTVDAGINWTNVSDRYFTTSSVGSIAVSESDPNIVYVGMGEACLRSNISHGDGVYKSTDAGKTWKNVGLRDSSQVGKVLIDPKEPNVVYVAAIGHPYGPNKERGVFRSQDGGQTWNNILFVDDKTGAADLVFDPHNSKTIYASMWQVLRRPWEIDEFGPGSGIYKSTDGGDHWAQLKEGLPTTDMGKIGLSVSPVNTDHVWATIGGEDGGKDGGIFRSDDAGKTWKLLNNTFEITSRQYYYGHIFADTQKPDLVYTFSSKSFYKSTDGGKTWDGRVQTPHSDYHDLWIDPHDDQRMINGNDGGATITFDGGRSWTSEMNQPTGQFYTVRADSGFPYRVYGAQQDDTTVSLSNESAGGGRGGAATGGVPFEEVGGGESGYVIPDLQDPNVVYAGAFWGLLTRYDRKAGNTRNITVWPDYPGGRTGSEEKYRFQWTFPIAETPAEPGAIYAGGNVVFKSVDQGQSWKPISPDLTRNDRTRENGGRLEDIYCTVFTIAPSPLDKNTIWAGSDDGLIHVTRDGGRTWNDVTPQAIEPWTRINIIDASPEDAATAYAAVNRYQMDDFRPYIYRTHDYGKNWTLVTSGIPEDTFVRTVREDPAQRKLLYAGTETGVYVSFDDGDHWQSLQLNLPIVPITDLTIRGNDLIASTQGRAFWVLDDVRPIEQVEAPAGNSALRVFQPRPAYHGGRGGRGGGRGGAGFSSTGVIVDYYLANASSQPVTIEFQDATGKTIKSFSSAERGGRGQAGVSAEAGLNRFGWDMRYPDAHGIEGGTFFLGGSLRGPEAIPGQYKVKVSVGDQSATQTFEIQSDPRSHTTPEAYRKQFDLLLGARDKLSAVDDAINQIHAVNQQVDAATKQANGNASVAASAQKLEDELNAVMHKLYEPRFTGYDDQTLIYPLGLNNRIAAMQSYAGGDYGPTEQDMQVYALLSSEIDQQLAKLNQALAADLPALNLQLKAAGVAPITVSSGTNATGSN